MIRMQTLPAAGTAAAEAAAARSLLLAAADPKAAAVLIVPSISDLTRMEARNRDTHLTCHHSGTPSMAEAL